MILPHLCHQIYLSFFQQNNFFRALMIAQTSAVNTGAESGQSHGDYGV